MACRTTAFAIAAAVLLLCSAGGASARPDPKDPAAVTLNTPAPTHVLGAPTQTQAAGKNCQRQWFGTAPACRGECPEGWTLIKEWSNCPGQCNSVALWEPCGACEGADFGYPCDAFSTKALCERCL